MPTQRGREAGPGRSAGQGEGTGLGGPDGQAERIRPGGLSAGSAAGSAADASRARSACRRRKALGRHHHLERDDQHHRATRRMATSITCGRSISTSARASRRRTMRRRCSGRPWGLSRSVPTIASNTSPCSASSRCRKKETIWPTSANISRAGRIAAARNTAKSPARPAAIRRPCCTRPCTRPGRSRSSPSWPRGWRPVRNRWRW